MTTLQNGSDPAFPSPMDADGELIGGALGLTKREFFAGLALAGLLAADSMIDGDTIRDSVFAADLLLEILARTPVAQ